MSGLWRAFHGLLPIAVVLAIVMAALLAMVWHLLTSDRSRAAAWLNVAFGGLWAIGLALVTLRPQPLMISATGVGVRREVDLTPGREIWAAFDNGNARVLLEQVVGNVVLFVPLGLALATAGRRRTLRHSVLIGFAVGVGVEVLQWAFGVGRVSSVDDVLLAGLGTVLGDLLGRACINALRTVRQTKGPATS